MQRRTPHEIWVYGVFETLLNLPQCGSGGEGGIRTLDTLLTYTPLAGERLQPLGHFSGNIKPIVWVLQKQLCRP